MIPFRIFERVRRERNALRTELAWAELRISLLTKSGATTESGWEQRARALWLIADPELRDGVLATIDVIERLEVIEP